MTACRRLKRSLKATICARSLSVSLAGSLEMETDQYRSAWPIMFALISVVSTGCTGVVSTSSPLATSVPPATAAELDEKFKSCVHKEAPTAVDETISKSGKNGLYGYHIGEFNFVISKCTGMDAKYSATFLSMLELMDESKFDKRFVYTKHTIDAEVKVKLDAFVNAELAVQHKKDKEREIHDAEAEKVLKEASAIYKSCLFNHTNLLAMKSQESADVLSVAILASCPKEKENLRTAYLKRYQFFDDGSFMQAFDKHVQPDIILRIVALRAASSVPAEPASEMRSNNRDQL